MSYISSLVLNDKFDHYRAEATVVDEKELKYIANLSKVNVFIGPNNSGKSNFLRLLCETNPYTYKPFVDVDKINDLIDKCCSTLKSFLKSQRARGVTESDADRWFEDFPRVEYVKEGKNFLDELDFIFARIGGKQPIKYVRNRSWHTDSMFQDDMKLAFSGLIAEKEAIDLELQSRKEIKFNRLYIPTLRGLRGFTSGEDCYLLRTQQDYFTTSPPAIFTGLGFYSQLKDLLLGDLESREIVTDFQNFLSTNFFYEQSVALIPRKDDNVIYVKIGNEDEFPIYRLGDGIQSIICLTFPLFVHKDQPLVAFIEEPELYMHPGLQRVLLNTLMQFDKHQYFLTTHSNHFLDLTLEFSEISVYTFRKELGEQVGKIASANFDIENVRHDDHNTLELLGVRNSSVFLSNCTIWVEGITDRRYLQHCLELYHRHVGLDTQYKLDTHYSFVEYSGGNITHWSFLDECSGINVSRLCGRLFLVSDRDAKDSYKAQRHVQLKSVLGQRYYVLNCREMENTLSPRVLAKVISAYEKGTIIIPEDFDQKDYRDAYLGKYIEEVLLKGNKARRGTYADKSGTVAQKTRFWDQALKEITSYDDLSSEIKKLVVRMSEFIKTCNDPI